MSPIDPAELSWTEYESRKRPMDYVEEFGVAGCGMILVRCKNGWIAG